ncbi:hypothetical protein A0257_16545 [Hymenobacter psoromatis]|nr:hypothetical protein A0257_16545 [Hymenobacter psoromatis]
MVLSLAYLIVVTSVAVATVVVAAVTMAPVMFVHYARRKGERAEHDEGQNVPKKGLTHCRRFLRSDYSA